MQSEYEQIIYSLDNFIKEVKENDRTRNKKSSGDNRSERSGKNFKHRKRRSLQAGKAR